MRDGLAGVAWEDAILRATAKGHPTKVELARLLRQYTPMTRAWIAQRAK